VIEHLCGAKLPTRLLWDIPPNHFIRSALRIAHDVIDGLGIECDLVIGHHQMISRALAVMAWPAVLPEERERLVAVMVARARLTGSTLRTLPAGPGKQHLEEWWAVYADPAWADLFYKPIPWNDNEAVVGFLEHQLRVVREFVCETG
jgi:hypothetical protein